MHPLLWPDNPTRVSFDMLCRMDSDAPGTWLYSAKMDGWRRIISRVDGVYSYRAKPAGSGELKVMPKGLTDAFESIGWPDNFVVDAEWLGNRVVEHVHEHQIYIFDLLSLDGCSLFNVPYSDRDAALRKLWWDSDGEQCANVFRLPTFTNPGAVAFFASQLCQPLSEGIVARRKDSKIIGHAQRCEEHPHVRKILKGSVKGYVKTA